MRFQHDTRGIRNLITQSRQEKLASQEGMARMQNETTQRGQDFNKETAQRGQDKDLQGRLAGVGAQTRGQDIQRDLGLKAHEIARDQLNQQGEYQQGQLGLGHARLGLEEQGLKMQGRNYDAQQMLARDQLAAQQSQFGQQHLLDQAKAARPTRTSVPGQYGPETQYQPGVIYDSDGRPILPIKRPDQMDRFLGQ